MSQQSADVSQVKEASWASGPGFQPATFNSQAVGYLSKVAGRDACATGLSPDLLPAYIHAGDAGATPILEPASSLS